MNRLVALILLAGACAGCTASRQQPISRLAIDPSFTATETDAILAAVDDWNGAGLGLHIAAEISACGPEYDAYAAPGSLGEGPDGEIAGRAFPSASQGRMLLNVSAIEDNGLSLETAAAHELGHLLLLQHTGAGSLMCAFTSCQADEVTPVDVAQFHLVWSE